MSNQLQITGGAKVRSLEGVITGTSGVLSSVPLGGANGVATLDSGGKVPVSQLPSSVVTYLGTWDASTNTPTLTNGTGDAGDMYICNVAGTVNFGAGPITFAVGDWVLYGSGTWQKSNGQNGTVTSVAVTESGNALTITGSPITTAGTINIGFAGSSTQYIAGDGTLVTFPTIITEAQNLITDVYNETGATLTKGTVVYINGGHGNLPTVTKAIATGDSTSAQTYGVVQADITNNNNGHVVVIGSLGDLDTQAYAAGTQLYLSSTTAGAWTSTKQYAPAHLVYVGIVVRSHPTQGVVEIKIQNGFELDELHNVSAQTPSNGDILQYNSTTSLWTSVAGTTTNIAEGTNLYFTNARAIGSTLTGYVSGAGTISSTDSILTAIQKLNGNVSGLVTGVSSVFGRTGAVVAASGDYTTTEVTEGTNLYFTNARARGAMSANVGSALTYDSATGRYTLLAADSGTSGYLTAADWTDFDSKQASLGTGTTSQYLRGDLTWATPPTPTLDDLTDVVITSPTNGQVLTYRFGDWKNETPASAPVTSVFGRTGVVVATSGDYNTDLVTEGTTNLYYTNTRARAALSANVGSALTYNSSTGRFTLNAADGTVDGYVTAADYNYWDAKQASLGTGTTSQWLRGDLTWSTVPAPALDDLTDVTITTPSNGQLLRYQAGTWINFTPTYIVAGYLSATAPLSYNSGTGVFSISQATTSTNGYLSSTDWNTFNGKQNTITLTTTGTSGAATLVGSTLNIPNYGSALSGYLPLTGGTLTGALNGTSATFSGDVNVGNGTAQTRLLIDSLGGSGGGPFIRFNKANVAKAYIGAYSAIVSGTSDDFGLYSVGGYQFMVNNSSSTVFSIATTGAATFSSSVTATQGLFYSVGSYNAITAMRNSDGDVLQTGRNGGTNNPYLRINANETSKYVKFILDGSAAYSDFIVNTGGSDRFIINTSGNLGLGSGLSFTSWSNSGNIDLNDVYLSLSSQGAYGGTISNNAYYNGSWKYKVENYATQYQTTGGQHRFLIAGVGGSAGATISWTQAMTLASTGNLLINTTTDAGYKLDVNGTGRFSGQLNANYGYFGNTGAGSWVLYTTNNDQSNARIRMNNSGAGGQTFDLVSGLNGTSNAGWSIYDATNGATRFSIASTGAATFSSSVNIGTTASTVYGTLNVIQQSISAPSFVRGIELVHPNGTGTTGGYIAMSMTGQKQGTIQVGDDATYGNLLLQSQGGNVGIGTSTITQPSSGATTLRIVGTSTTKGGAIYLDSSDTSVSSYIYSDNTSGLSINTSTSHSIVFRTVDTERMRITSGGNVGIGIASPSTKLTVNGTGSLTTGNLYYIAQFANDQTNYKGIALGYDNSGQIGVIYPESNGAASSLAFWTWNGSAWGERMRITNGGNILIGTTTDAGYKLDVNGTLRVVSGASPSVFNTATGQGIAIENSGSSNKRYRLNVDGTSFLITEAGVGTPLTIAAGGAASFSSSVTATGFFESSSVVYKNILETNPETCLNIDVIKYTRKNVDVNDVRYGYSAEQINSLMPELTNKEATAVRYIDVHTLLIAELQREIKELKAKLNN